MFEDVGLRTKLAQLFSANTDRFDQLAVAAGLDPRTDLVGADLRGADFAGSVMDRWDLSSCDLTGASFSGAKIRDLITKDAIGVNLSGAVPLNDIEEDRPDRSDTFESIVEEIRSSTTGVLRGPLIKKLLADHASDERTWSFLLNHQLIFERVGRFVSMIIDAWESRQEPATAAAGNQLRIRLLREGGNSYITVRARLLRELASRLGRNEELLELCKDAIRREGYWTSGAAALSILAQVFTGDREVASFLESLLSGRKWSGSKSEVIFALLKGFDSPTARKIIESAIGDELLPMYERIAMLRSYYRAKQDDPNIVRFVDGVFQDSEPELRAAALRAKTENGRRASGDILANLQSVAKSDKDYQVRVAALDVIGSSAGQLDFLQEIATTDQDEHVRSCATRAVDRLGYSDREWYIKIFRNDPSDDVRNAALSWFLAQEQEAVGKNELRDLLIEEMKRAEPGFTAARAAYNAIELWPNDNLIRNLARSLVIHLPKNTGGWNQRLRVVLEKLSQINGRS